MSTARESQLTAPVVVGVDGSATSLSAVDLAAREATLRRRPLQVVHGFIWPEFHVALGPSPAGPAEGGLRHQAEHIVDEAVERARSAAPNTTVTGHIITGAPAPVLLRHAHTAALLVIGDRGLGGFTGLMVGSVAVELAAHADCPILIARGIANRTGPVVVGVDGSPANDPAVGYAFETAALHHVPLLALHAWEHPVSTGTGDMLPLMYDPAVAAADETRIVTEAVADWRGKYPDVTVETTVVHGGPRTALVKASTEAQLVVVGTRGRGGFTGLLLGSVSQAVLHHADCPVAIIPHPRQPQ
jgi:nucleotide-binding universal stress UspA family protein